MPKIKKSNNWKQYHNGYSILDSSLPVTLQLNPSPVSADCNSQPTQTHYPPLVFTLVTQTKLLKHNLMFWRTVPLLVALQRPTGSAALSCGACCGRVMCLLNTESNTHEVLGQCQRHQRAVLGSDSSRQKGETEGSTGQRSSLNDDTFA